MSRAHLTRKKGETVKYFCAIGMLVLVALVAVGCEPMKVANPAYTNWVSFKPGSSVTYTGEETAGGKTSPFRIQDTLVETTKDRVLVERQIEVVDNGKTTKTKQVIVEYAKINPQDHALTNPHAKIQERGTRTVNVGSEALSCRTVEVDVKGSFGEFIKTPAQMHIEAAISERIPGGIVTVAVEDKTPNHSRKLKGQAVAFDTK